MEAKQIFTVLIVCFPSLQCKQQEEKMMQIHWRAEKYFSGRAF